MQNLVSFAIVAGIITITPGLDTFMVLRSSIQHGLRSGLLASLGVNAGLLVWAFTSAAGVAAIIVASQEAFTVLRIAGALYLAWLGIKSLRQAARNDPKSDANPGLASLQGWAAFRAGLINNLLNPKVGVFYITIFPQFIPADGNAMVWGSGLAVIHVIEGVAWLVAVSLFAATLRPLLARPVVTRSLDVISGLVFLAFGARVARDVRG
jgi:threonine/homoserine/homoserine lactone efflux protein